MKEGRKLKKSNLNEAQVVEKVQRKKKEKVSNVEHPQAITTEKPNRNKVELKKKKSNKVSEEISDVTPKAISNEKIKGKKGKLNKTKNKRKADEISSAPVDDHLMKEADDDKGSSETLANDGTETRNRKSKKSNKKRKMKLIETSSEKMNKVEEEEDVYEISSGDEDCSKGMKKWVTDYYENRPGLDELQKRIDDFMTAHEERLEQEKQEREAKAAEGGWTVVVHHKGRKKTTDAESGTAVGSVSQAALEDQVAKKKKTEIVGHGFYRFQRRDAQRSELLALQTKFEEDKKRIQQIRAARKFKPY
ncbi:Ribosomal RNA-processing 7 protein [Hirschfeldia incana]|nr:Ribosomal RNA-processing 7 protein [Hirschfeldia incana]